MSQNFSEMTYAARPICLRPHNDIPVHAAFTGLIETDWGRRCTIAIVQWGVWTNEVQASLVLVSAGQILQ